MVKRIPKLSSGILGYFTLEYGAILLSLNFQARLLLTLLYIPQELNPLLCFLLRKAYTFRH